MILADEYVEVGINHKNMRHYIDLGYDIPTKVGKSGKLVVIQGSKIKVKTKDLTYGSNVYVNVICDYCGKPYKTMFNNYNKMRDKGTPKDACVRCSQKKREDSMMLKYNVKTTFEIEDVKRKCKETIRGKYGVEHVTQNLDIKQKITDTCMERYNVPNPFMSETIKEKIRNTNIIKYGTPYVSQNTDVKEKIKNTNIEKYGVPYTIQNPEVREKAKKKMIEKYGYENPSLVPSIVKKIHETNMKKYGFKVPSMSPLVQEKMKQTNMEKYGHEYVFSVPQVQEKIRKALLANGKVNTSSQQIYLNNLYGGKLNYLVSRFFVDIYVKKDNICVEYDGGGHDLKVQIGEMTQDEFDYREMVREKIIRTYGNRIIRIISNNDKLPHDNILLKMYDDALTYFNSTGHTWRKYYVEEGLFQDFEHKDREFYDYGSLWSAKSLANKNKTI